MGGLLSKYKTNKDKEASGVWVTFDGVVNDDGTRPSFKVKRITVYERAYQAQLTPILAQLNKLSKAEIPDALEFTETNKKLFKIYINHFLVDWKDVKEPAEINPETGSYICDDNGVPICKEIPFTKNNAEELLCDPDLIEVAQWLMKQSSDVNNFLIGNRETELKN